MRIHKISRKISGLSKASELGIIAIEATDISPTPNAPASATKKDNPTSVLWVIVTVVVHSISILLIIPQYWPDDIKQKVWEGKRLYKRKKINGPRRNHNQLSQGYWKRKQEKEKLSGF